MAEFEPPSPCRCSVPDSATFTLSIESTHLSPFWGLKLDCLPVNKETVVLLSGPLSVTFAAVRNVDTSIANARYVVLQFSCAILNEQLASFHCRHHILSPPAIRFPSLSSQIQVQVPSTHHLVFRHRSSRQLYRQQNFDECLVRIAFVHLIRIAPSLSIMPVVKRSSLMSECQTCQQRCLQYSLHNHRET